MCMPSGYIRHIVYISIYNQTFIYESPYQNIDVNNLVNCLRLFHPCRCIYNIPSAGRITNVVGPSYNTGSTSCIHPSMERWSDLFELSVILLHSDW